MTRPNNMSHESWLDACLERIAHARVAVFGDFCLDAYWPVSSDQGEVSIETGLPVYRVTGQRYSLGGAGNVVANLVDLGVAQVAAVGVVGDDLFGQKMLQLLQTQSVDTRGIFGWQPDWQTLVYAKPHVKDQELNRMDFGAFNTIAQATIDVLASTLDRVAGDVDVVILNQQLPAGVSIPQMIDRVNQVIAKHPRCRFIVDSRHRAELYHGAILKLNAHEAARMQGEPRMLDERIPAGVARALATRLAANTGQPVFLTRGEHGLLVADGLSTHEVPGIQIIEPVDPVGAGDTVVATLAAAIGSGADLLTAARLANLAASITVRKLQTTGTATPAELRAAGPNPDYVYHPELADDPRGARYWNAPEIEIIRNVAPARIRHAIFDHDGTISTLREGWERIMEPMMLRAILGSRYGDADETLYHNVLVAVRSYIDKTTGIQTLVQMQGLVELVRQFGCVPAEQILDMHGYKCLYNQELLAMVRARIAKLRRGELAPEDFQIKNAHKLLAQLHGAGVKLYLASGTDAADVANEAAALGYAELFQGRIFGAVGDVRVEAKRQVLERIIAENAIAGPEVAVFGDGPAEIRLGRQRRCLGVGVASDEARRFGCNPVKRSRLIRAGADIVVGDFSQLDSLLELLAIRKS